MVVAVVISLIFILVLYILFAPITVQVDTFSDRYFIKQPGTFSAVVFPDESKILRIKTRIFFFSFSIYPIDQIRKKKRGAKKSQMGKKKGWKRFRIEKVKRFIRTFKINEFLLDIDTGDFTKNAQLYPVFYFLNHGTDRFRINYEGRLALKLDVTNRPVNVLKLFV